LNTDLLKHGHRYFLQKMAALLKLNDMRSVIQNGGIFNHGRLFNKGKQTESFGEKVSKKVSEMFSLCNASGKRKNIFF
jgi:hypothetical protein